MSKKTLPYNQKTITNSLGRYYRAVETDVFVYFVNFEESDENGQIKMYRKEENNLSLVSDNYFAFVGIMDDLREGNETWMSPRMKKERQIYVDEVILPLVKEYLELSDKADLGERFNELEQEIDEYHVELPEHDVAMFLKEKFNL